MSDSIKRMSVSNVTVSLGPIAGSIDITWATSGEPHIDFSHYVVRIKHDDNTFTGFTYQERYHHAWTNSHPLPRGLYRVSIAIFDTLQLHPTAFTDDVCITMPGPRETINTKIKRMSITEFRELGYLQEVNRQFLHPLGLSLGVNVGDVIGEESLGVWDCRDGTGCATIDDGMLDEAKAAHVRREFTRLAGTRFKALGYSVQPVRKHDGEGT